MSEAMTVPRWRVDVLLQSGERIVFETDDYAEVERVRRAAVRITIALQHVVSLEAVRTALAAYAKEDTP